jgi:hypothetical protein
MATAPFLDLRDSYGVGGEAAVAPKGPGLGACSFNGFRSGCRLGGWRAAPSLDGLLFLFVVMCARAG